ncbi:hypothetical protein J2T13_002274 [Paenibacillus sp. DS2015]|uniref:hypothetical protein n=1 Tax=Paenibacillus sp. DS2015 TaxID=3373917 RepID=UPI003D1E75BE
MKKSDKLIHVQRPAIRELLYQKVEEKDLHNRFNRVTGRTAKDLKEALNRTEKETLIKMVNLSSEITELDVEQCFEEYRYSSRPSFRLYLLTPIDPKFESSSMIKKWGNNKAVEQLNVSMTEREHAKGVWKNIRFLDQTQVEADTLEISFSYEQVHNFISPDTEDNDSIYELKYGFIWINVTDRFLSISVPTDSITGVLIDGIHAVFPVFTIATNISDSLIDRLFRKDNLKRKTLYNPNPPTNMPTRVTLSDSKMGDKTTHLAQYEGYQSPSTVFEEEVEDSSYTTLGINSNKGKLYLTKQLKASKLRDWGLKRIKQLMGYINGSYKDGDIQAVWDSLGIESDINLVEFAFNKIERTAILEVVKGIVQCKKQGMTTIALHYTPRFLLEQVRKYSTSFFTPYCDTCDSFIELSCSCCGKSELNHYRLLKDEVKVNCSFCGEKYNEGTYQCAEGHNIIVSSNFEGIQIIPNSGFSELVSQLVTRYFPSLGFSLEKESFYFSNNVMHYTNSTPSKVMFKVADLPQFQPIRSVEVTLERRNKLVAILEILKEKCSRQSVEGCRQCQSEKSVLCVMKPFISFTDHILHPHHGQEFGDVSFTLNLGVDDSVFVGVAKSYEKKTVTESSDKGREMIQQFLKMCLDQRVHVVGLIIAANVDQGLTALCQHIARLHNKKVVMWYFDDLVHAINHSILEQGLDIDDVMKDVMADSKKRARNNKPVTKPSVKKNKVVKAG